MHKALRTVSGPWEVLFLATMVIKVGGPGCMFETPFLSAKTRWSRWELQGATVNWKRLILVYLQ